MRLTVEKVPFLFQQNVIQSFRLTVWLHTHPGTRVFELGLNGSRLRLLIFHKISPRTHHTICNKSLLRDRSLFIAWGRGEGSGAKQGEIWSDPPFECYFLIPPHNIS